MTLLVIAGLLGLLAVAAAVAALVASRLDARELAVRHVDGGLEVPGSRAVAGCLLVALAAALAFPFALLAAILLEEARAGSSTMVAVALLVPVLAVPTVLGLLRGRYHLNRLRLTPQGVEVHTYRAPTAIDWDDLAAVVRTPGASGRWVLRASRPDAVRRPAAGPIGERSVNPGLATDTDLQTGLLSGGDKVVALVKHFLDHPEDRAKLASPIDQSSLDAITGGTKR